MKRGELKKLVADLEVNSVLVIPASPRRNRSIGTRVPPPVYKYSKFFGYSIKTFNDKDGMIQILRTK